MRNLFFFFLIALQLNANAQVRPVFEIPLDFDHQWLPQAYDTLKTTSIAPRADGSGIIDTAYYNYIVFRNAAMRVDSAWGGYRFVVNNGVVFIDTFFIDQKAIGVHYGDSSVFIEKQYQGAAQGWQNRYRVSVHYRESNRIDRYYSEYYQSVGGWDGQITQYLLNFNANNVYTGYERYSKSATTLYTLNRVMKREVNGTMPVSDSLINMPSNTFVNKVMYTTSGNRITLADVYSSSGFDGTGLYEYYPNDRLRKFEAVNANSPAKTIYEFLGNNTSSGIKNLENSGALVYPNPFSEQVVIKWNNGKQNTATVQIVDLTGKTIVQTTLTGNNFLADTRSWPAGCYFYSISIPEEPSLKGKIIKQ